MNNKDLQFKVSLNGFNKDEVINYIESLNGKYQKMEASYKQQIEELKENNNVTVNKNNDNDNEIEKELIALKEENNKLKNQILLYQENEKNVESNPYKEKADLYDKMSSQLGSMIIMANDKAEDIINSANIKVEEAKNELKFQIDSLNNQIYNEFVMAIEGYTQEFYEFNNLIREVCGKLNMRTEEIKNNMSKKNYELKQTLINEINELKLIHNDNE